MIKIKYKKLLYGGGLRWGGKTFHNDKDGEKCVEKMRKDARHYDIEYITD